MKKIYDNGALLLGNPKIIIDEFNRQKKEYEETDEIVEEIIKDLEELKDIADIVMINYDNLMGYSIDYWGKSDIYDWEKRGN